MNGWVRLGTIRIPIAWRKEPYTDSKGKTVYRRRSACLSIGYRRFVR